MLTNADWYILFLKIDVFGAEILRVTTLMGNASVLGQSGLEHASPLATGGIFSNGGADVNGWASRFQSEVWILTINITSLIHFHLILYFRSISDSILHLMLTQDICFSGCSSNCL